MINTHQQQTDSMNLSHLFKYTLLIFAALMLLFAFAGTADAFAGGAGTQASPFWVSTPAHLEMIGSDNFHRSAHYILINDITLTGTWTPIGNQTHPFTGTINGNNHTIYGMDVSGGSHVGFIGMANGATISNLRFSGSSVIGQSHVGTVTGQASHSTFENIHVTGGTVDCFGDGGHIGGLVGHLQGGQIYNSSADNHISAYSNAGGLVGGITAGGIVNRSEFRGTVQTSNWSVGGLAGFMNPGVVESSHVRGAQIFGHERAAGLVGGMGAGSYVRNSSVADDLGTPTVVWGTNLVGGLVGQMNGGGTIYNSTSSATLTGVSS